MWFCITSLPLPQTRLNRRNGFLENAEYHIDLKDLGLVVENKVESKLEVFVEGMPIGSDSRPMGFPMTNGGSTYV